jgi:hypothetical protein
MPGIGEHRGMASAGHLGICLSAVDSPGAGMVPVEGARYGPTGDPSAHEPR